jgi:hypothetical protein
MSDRALNVLATVAGAVAGSLLADWHSRRKAERRTLTEADQKWMAATHGDGDA